MKVLLVLMAQLTMWDGLITQTFVSNGLAKEGNPLMASFVSQGSFLPLKLIGLIACIPLLWFVYKRFPRLTVATTSSVIAFYGLVLTWNFSVFFWS